MTTLGIKVPTFITNIELYGQESRKTSFVGFYYKLGLLTLLGLGLIKINDVSANFNNPRPSLILNN